MLTLGLIGGLTYPSTLQYYQRLNELIGEQLGGIHGSKMIIYSLDAQCFMDRAAVDDNFKGVKTLMLQAARVLLKAGADVLVICCNTAHLSVDMIQESLGRDLPILHIADVVACAINTSLANNNNTGKKTKVGFLGSSITMENPFLVNRLRAHGLDVILPELSHTRNQIQQVIEKDLAHSRITQTGKQVFLNAIDEFRKRGAQGIVLGCTEIGMLIKSTDVPDMKVFDSTILHIQAASDVQMGLKKCSQYEPKKIKNIRRKKKRSAARFTALKVVSLVLAGSALIWGLWSSKHFKAKS